MTSNAPRNSRLFALYALIALGIGVWSLPVIGQAAPSVRRPSKPAPFDPDKRRGRYHLDTDEFEPDPGDPLGGLTRDKIRRGHYAGNRLKQFRFLGPKGRGGLYDALDSYHEKLKLDPAKYRYRIQTH